MRRKCSLCAHNLNVSGHIQAKQLSLHQALTKALKGRKAVVRRSASAASQSKLNKKPRRLQNLEKVLQMEQDAVDADARSRETSPSISLPQKRAVGSLSGEYTPTNHDPTTLT